MAKLARLTTLKKTNPVALRLDAPPEDAVTFLHGSSGGSIWADVISQISAGEDFARKQLGAPRYDAFSVQVGLTIPALLFDWIAASWKSDPPRHDGALLLCNQNLAVQEERGFQSALLAVTAFPALDAASKELAYVTLWLAPRSILSDKKVQGAGPVAFAPKQKLWLASNFRIQIEGLDCTHVSRIEPFSIRRKIEVVTAAGGGAELIPGPVDFPNLRITMSAAHAASWLAWHEDFVLKGHNTAAFEKSGSISLLTPNLQTELTRLELEGLGIFRITSEEMDVGRIVPRVIADVYCEQMRLVPGGSP